MKLKNKLIVTLLSSTLAFTPVAATASGVPVVDVSSIAQMVQQMVKDAEHYSSVLSNWNDQIKAAESTLQGLTGLREVGSIINQLGSLKNTTQSMMDAMKNPQTLIDGGFDALDGDAKKLMEQFGVGERCEKGYEGNEGLRKMCEAKIIANIQTIQRKTEVANDMQQLINRLDQIAAAAPYARDIKEAQDIANQIALVQTSMQVIQFNYEMINTDERTFTGLTNERDSAIKAELRRSSRATFSNPFDRSSNQDQQW